VENDVSKKAKKGTNGWAIMGNVTCGFIWISIAAQFCFWYT
jgi:hypothetical protein